MVVVLSVVAIVVVVVVEALEGSVCAGIKEVYTHPIIHSRNFQSGDQCSGQAHKISA